MIETFMSTIPPVAKLCKLNVFFKPILIVYCAKAVMGELTKGIKYIQAKVIESSEIK
jgi:hypothetical protein